jgi:hypothetical protein
MCSARAVAADAWQIVHLQPGADVSNPLFVVDECPRCGRAMPATLWRPTPGAFVLVVIDTLARAMVGDNENLAQDMGLFIAG